MQTIKNLNKIKTKITLKRIRELQLKSNNYLHIL